MRLLLALLRLNGFAWGASEVGRLVWGAKHVESVLSVRGVKSCGHQLAVFQPSIHQKLSRHGKLWEEHKHGTEAQVLES